jgi:serine/threonine-protein kinase HipA
VADAELVRLETVEGLLEEIRVPNNEEEALLVRRFDRTEGPERIHVEDFLQVLDRFPEYRAKYHAGNYDQFGRLLRALVGDEVITEYLRRIVFNAAVGNGDAHLKNWMIRYPDGVSAKLAPAFDLVSTIQYLDTDQDEFALNFAKTKRYDELSLGTVERFATALCVPGRVDLPPATLVDVAADMATRIVQAWPAFAARHNIPAEFTQRLREHWGRTPLMSGRR